jgi:uncharacterized protein YqjF (DUF2071 family)
MVTFHGRRTLGAVSALLVALVWVIHGAYNKLLHGSPRHLAIVQSVPGFDGAMGEHVLAAVGLLEVAIAVWVLSAWTPFLCAAVQTTALLSMNIVELSVARDLLMWPAGLVPLNLAFLALAWTAAATRERGGFRARLRRHPLAVKAHFQDCLTLTYAVPPEILRPLLPPGLELETFRGYGFVAVALVQTDSLRPAGLPAALGQDFFLAGYRIFTTFAVPGGDRLRGLRILRSDANRALMVAGGNLLTHYHYHHCDAHLESSGGRLHVRVETPDRFGDLDVTMDASRATLPAGSPFRSWREARRFAGPLLWTFDYEPETHAIVAIKGMRTHWKPAPVSVAIQRLAFFEQPEFHGCTPLLAAAFHVDDIEYRWERGIRYPLGRQSEGRVL